MLQQNADMPNERSLLRGCDIPSEHQVTRLREFLHDAIPNVTLPTWRLQDTESIDFQAAFEVTRPRIHIITGSSFNAVREVSAVEVDAEGMLDDDADGSQAVTARER
jgi:hypothetical protein